MKPWLRSTNQPIDPEPSVEPTFSQTRLLLERCSEALSPQHNSVPMLCCRRHYVIRDAV